MITSIKEWKENSFSYKEGDMVYVNAYGPKTHGYNGDTFDKAMRRCVNFKKY